MRRDETKQNKKQKQKHKKQRLPVSQLFSQPIAKLLYFPV